jgi:hypothetical protein
VPGSPELRPKILTVLLLIKLESLGLYVPEGGPSQLPGSFCDQTVTITITIRKWRISKMGHQ